MKSELIDQKRLSWSNEAGMLLTKEIATLPLWHSVSLQTFCQEDNLSVYVGVYRMVPVGQKLVLVCSKNGPPVELVRREDDMGLLQL